MTINRKPTGRASSIPAGIMLGIMSAMFTLLAGTAIAAKLIDMEKLRADQIGYAVLIIMILSAWVSAVISSKRIKRMRLVICAVSGGCYFVMLMIITGLMFGGRYSGVGETFLLILCGSVMGCFTQLPHNNKKIRRIG